MPERSGSLGRWLSCTLPSTRYQVSSLPQFSSACGAEARTEEAVLAFHRLWHEGAWMHVPRSSLIAPLHRSKIEQHARTTSLWTLVLIDKPLAASLYAALKLHSTTTFGGLCVGKLDCLRSTLVVMQRCMKTLYETLYGIACGCICRCIPLNTASPPCDGPAVTAYSHTAPYSGGTHTAIQCIRYIRPYTLPLRSTG